LLGGPCFPQLWEVWEGERSDSGQETNLGNQDKPNLLTSCNWGSGNQKERRRGGRFSHRKVHCVSSLCYNIGHGTYQTSPDNHWCAGGGWEQTLFGPLLKEVKVGSREGDKSPGAEGTAR